VKLAVIGSRDFDNYELVKTTLDAIPDITLIVSGGAKEADSLGERYANENNIPTKIFKPDRSTGIGRRAGYHLRNIAVIDNAEHAVAFWDGQSHGTKHALNHARKKNSLSKRCIFLWYKALK